MHINKIMESVTESDGVGSSIDKSELFQHSPGLLGEDVTRRRRCVQRGI